MCPTYDYKCPNGHTLTDFESMSASAVRLCPDCFHACPEHGKMACPTDCPEELVYMERQIGGGGGVIWRGGSPTPKFSGRRR